MNEPWLSCRPGAGNAGPFLGPVFLLLGAGLAVQLHGLGKTLLGRGI